MHASMLWTGHFPTFWEYPWKPNTTLDQICSPLPKENSVIFWDFFLLPCTWWGFRATWTQIVKENFSPNTSARPRRAGNWWTMWHIGQARSSTLPEVGSGYCASVYCMQGRFWGKILIIMANIDFMLDFLLTFY